MKTIRALELESLLEADEPVEIVDIRPLDEFEKVHIEGAHPMPSAELSPEKLMWQRELLPTEPLILISQSGALAQLTAFEFERRGLDNLVVLSGGMHAWQQNSLPVVQHSTMSDWLSQHSDGFAR